MHMSDKHAPPQPSQKRQVTDMLRFKLAVQCAQPA